MKTIKIAGVLLLALVTMLATVSLSAAGDSVPQSVPQKAALHKCCTDAAQAGKGCCGKDAAATKAAYDDQVAGEAVVAGMHKCCAGALTAGKGCCGKDAAALKASYETDVASYKTAATVKAGLQKCCAGALTAGKGCCGKDAAGLKADYEKKVKAASQELAAK